MNLEVAWNKATFVDCDAPFAIVLIHGFGACKEHWRNNQLAIAKASPCFAIDLIGFGKSSQPESRLNNEQKKRRNRIISIIICTVLTIVYYIVVLNYI